MKTEIRYDRVRGFTADVGYVEGSRSQPRFLLGRDEREAERKRISIVGLWERQQKGNWTQENLKAARSIAAGESLRVLPKPRLPDDWHPGWSIEQVSESIARQYVAQLVAASQRLPVDVAPAHPELAEFGAELAGREIMERQQKLDAERVAIEKAVGTVGPASKPLHILLDRYQQSLVQRESSGLQTEPSIVSCQRVGFLKRIIKDVPLSKLDWDMMRQVVLAIKARPMSQRRKLISVSYAKALTKSFKDFVRHVYRTNEDWNPPRDWDSAFRVRRARRTEDERVADGSSDPMTENLFTEAELSLIWRACKKPTHRAIFLIGLNCGHGVSEACTLQWAEVKGNMVNRLRPKSEVYGQWELWPETMDALARLPKRGRYVLTRHGTDKPLLGRTRTGKRADKLSPIWRLILQRAKVPLKSYGKLKKTAASIIRRKDIGGAEVASMHIAHGVTSGDDLLEVYAAKPWHDLAEATKNMRELLKKAGVF